METLVKDVKNLAFPDLLVYLANAFDKLIVEGNQTLALCHLGQPHISVICAHLCAFVLTSTLQELFDAGCNAKKHEEVMLNNIQGNTHNVFEVANPSQEGGFMHVE